MCAGRCGRGSRGDGFEYLSDRLVRQCLRHVGQGYDPDEIMAVDHRQPAYLVSETHRASGVMMSRAVVMIYLLLCWIGLDYPRGDGPFHVWTIRPLRRT